MKKIFNKNLKFVTIFSIVFLGLFLFSGHSISAQEKVTDPAGAKTALPDASSKTPPPDASTSKPTEKSGLQITLTNPLKSNTLEDFIQIVLGVILKFLIPILAILFMYTGFKLVMARGEPKALQAAKQDFFNLVIGAVLILGAWTFGSIIMNTLKEVGILN